MKWSLAGLVVVGIIAAVSAALLVATMQSGGGPTVAREITIVKAKRDLKAFTVVRAEDVEEVKVQRGKEPEGALTGIEKVVGKPLIFQMSEGQTFTGKSFVPEGGGANLAAMLKPGMRAVSVSLADYAGLNGLLYPGAHVDVLASFRLTSGKTSGTAVSTTLLQDVMVLAIEDESVVSGEQKPEVTAQRSADLQLKVNRKWRITLMVDTKQDKALQLAMEHGQISFAMRNPTDNNKTDSEATLLNEGQLARLSAALAPTSTSDNSLQELLDPKAAKPADKITEEPAPQPPPLPVVERPTPPRPTWDVTIIRGADSETRSFLYEDKDTPKVARPN